MSLRRADGRRRAERAEHAARRARDCVHARVTARLACSSSIASSRGRAAAALASLESPPLVIDVDDPEYVGPRRPHRRDRLRGAAGRGRPATPRGVGRPTSGTRSRSTTRRARPAIPRASSTAIAARISTRSCDILTWSMPRHAVYLWTLPMFHCNGWCFPWALAAVAGTNVCLRKVDAAAVVRADQGAPRHALLRRADRAQHAAATRPPN